MRRAIGLVWALGITGCALVSPPSLPTPAPSAEPAAIAASVPPSPSPAPVTPDGPWMRPSSPYSYPSPWPHVTAVPAHPITGETVALTATDLPPGRTIEFWLVRGPSSELKMGLHHPETSLSRKLGSLQADASGRASLSFPFERIEREGRVGFDSYEVWLVYPESKVVAPMVGGIQPGWRTTVQGGLFDEHGAPVTGATQVRAIVHGDDGAIVADRTVATSDGHYTLVDLPFPGQVELVVTHGTWPTRRRWASFGPTIIMQDSHQDHFDATFNFGGPAGSPDPDAPGYFLSPDLDDPAMAQTVVTGHVYDTEGHPVAASAGVIFTVAGALDPIAGRYYRANPTIQDGAYRLEGVPTGIPLIFTMQLNPNYGLRDFKDRYAVLLPERVQGKPNVFNFGGPATAEDPEGPAHPVPLHPSDAGMPSPWVPQP